jgi:hypothetical protein
MVKEMERARCCVFFSSTSYEVIATLFQLSILSFLPAKLPLRIKNDYFCTNLYVQGFAAQSNQRRTIIAADEDITKALQE